MRSPPARGWPEREGAAGGAAPAFPARAGMARAGSRPPRGRTRVPRPRGDGPAPVWRVPSRKGRSPPARGWPAGLRGADGGLGAFPARAGMARKLITRAVHQACVPRPRGDGPAGPASAAASKSRSPPARGWPDAGPVGEDHDAAFPARAGMARRTSGARFRAPSVPRPRGDGPRIVPMAVLVWARSPPARGWPVSLRGLWRRGRAFPARAGMARRGRSTGWRSTGVPRPRGDGPGNSPPNSSRRSRSPPARGWPGGGPGDFGGAFAFPARAGMARRTSGARFRAPSVPRPRGDGP